MQVTDSTFLKKVLFKINDDHFYKALKITLCAIIIFAFFYNNKNFAFSLGMILGLSLSSQIDTSNNLKDKILSLGLTSIAVPIITLFLTYTHKNLYFFYVIFSFFVFSSAIISLYGQRASQFSYMLLIGISLTFLDIANVDYSLTNSKNIFYGGILYLIISVIFYLIRPSRYINLELAICIDNISKYLELRSELWGENPDENAIEEKQLNMQVTINESFQKINEYLEVNKTRIINSKSNRKVILASSFIQEIMELSLSNVFSDSDIKLHIDKQPKLRESIKEITENFSKKLQLLSESIQLKTEFKPTINLLQNLADIQKQINNDEQLNNESQIYLNSILDYLNEQIKKIRGLERAFTENISTIDLNMNSDEIQKYFKPKSYRFKTIIENLNFKSVHFRYATRLTLAMLIGLFLGSFDNFKHEYWILSTIVLIMQPGYGLTKSRMNQRIIGTIFGGLIGVCLLFFISSKLEITILTTFAMLLSVWFSSTDYKVGVIFNTLYMILLYGILKTGVEANFLYKILDTIAGAVVAFMATNYLWPSWEFLSIKDNLIDSIKSAKSYINEFKDIYIQKKSDEVTLQQSRQNAFIAIGNLMASYQRLVQEPKSKQQNRAQLYEIAIINQSLIGAIASLGNYIRAHQENNSFKTYGNIFNTVIYNLDSSLNYFDQSIPKDNNLNICNSDTINALNLSLTNQLKALKIDDSNARAKLEESQLVLTQLNWIVNLSEQILKASKEIK